MDVFNLPADPNANPDLDDDFRALIVKLYTDCNVSESLDEEEKQEVTPANEPTVSTNSKKRTRKTTCNNVKQRKAIPKYCQSNKSVVRHLGLKVKKAWEPSQAVIHQTSSPRKQRDVPLISPGFTSMQAGEQRRLQLFKLAEYDDVATCKTICEEINPIHNLSNTEWTEKNTAKNVLHIALECYSKNVIQYLLDICSKELVVAPYDICIENRRAKQTSLHALVQNAEIGDPQRLNLLKRILTFTKQRHFWRVNTGFIDKITVRKTDGLNGKLHHLSALHMAAFRGDTDMVESLISQGATIDNSHANGATPLFYAIRSGYMKTTKKLVDLKANVNYVTSNGSTPLYWAVRYERADIVRFLLSKRGTDIAPLRSRGFGLPLILAAALGNQDIVDIFLHKNVDKNSQNTKQRTALHFAAALGHVNIIEILAAGQPSKNLDVNAMDKSGHTALMYAVKGNHVNALKLLIDLGADISSRNYNQQSAWQLALTNNAEFRRETLSVLVEKYKVRISQGNTDLHAAENVAEQAIAVYTNCLNVVANTLKAAVSPLNEAATLDNPELISELIQLGINKEECDSRGENFFHVAVRSNSLKILETFVTDATHTMLNKQNVEGDTPLHLAAKHDRCEAAKILIKNAATDQLATKIDTLQSPLYLAVRTSPDMTTILLGNFPAVQSQADEVDDDGNTFLHIGALEGNMDVLRAFINHTDVDERNIQGDTALHVAIRSNQKDAIYFLMENKASLGIADNYGRTPLHIAASVMQISAKVTIDIVKAIKESGNLYLLDEADNDGKTPLHLAAKKGKLDSVKPLVSLDSGAVDGNGNSALHEAAIRNKSLFIKEMIAVFGDHCNFQIDQQNYEKETVLHICAKNGSVESVRLLMRKGANLLAKNSQGDTVLHSVVAETVIEPHKTDLMLKVYDVIVEESVVWWCKTKHAEIPNQTSFAHGQLKRYAVLELTACTNNDKGFTVVGMATALGASQMLEKILNTPKVYRFAQNKGTYGEIIYDYDVTYLIPAADPEKIRCNVVSFAENFVSGSKMSSCLDILSTSGNDLTAAQILEITPIKQLVKGYWSAYQWTYGIMMIVHVIHMSLFTAYSFRVLPYSIRHVSKRETNIEYLGFLLWPGCLLMFEIYYLIVIIITGSQSRTFQRVMQKSAKEWNVPYLNSKRSVSDIALSFADHLHHLAALLFCTFVITWYVLHLMSNTNQVYLVVVILIIGWLYATSFLRGFKSVYAFNEILKYIFVCNMTRFMFVYIFILLAFGFALHALLISDPNYTTPVWDTLFMTFNMMLGMGDLFLTEEFEISYRAAGLNPTVPKIVYLIYIILTTIVFLNLLIAMMTDTYSHVQNNEAHTWQISTVTMAVHIERRMAFIKRVWSNIRGSDDGLRLVELESPERRYLQPKHKLYRCMTTLTLDQSHQLFPHDKTWTKKNIEKQLEVLTECYQQLTEQIQTFRTVGDGKGKAISPATSKGIKSKYRHGAGAE